MNRIVCRASRLKNVHTTIASTSRFPTLIPDGGALNVTSSWTNHCQSRQFSSEFYDNYLSSSSPPIGLAQTVLESVHDVTGLPWWGSIIVSTVALRTIVTLPVAIYSMKNMDKVAKLQPELAQLSQDLKLEVARAVKQFKWDYKFARYKFNSTMKKLAKERYVRDNCHPFKSTLVVLIQLPLWFAMSFALRNMSGYVPMQGAENVPVPGLTSEGCLWFSNLAVPDSTWILPITLGALNLTLTEINAYRMTNPTKPQKLLTNLFRVLSVVMVPIGATVPSCMCLYWTISSAYGLVQNMVLKRPGVRKKLGLSSSPIKVDQVKDGSLEGVDKDLDKIRNVKK